MEPTMNNNNSIMNKNVIITHLLVNLIVLIYIAQIVTGDKLAFFSLEFDIATRGRLVSWGAKVNRSISEGQLWRLATYAFLHFDFFQLLQVCYVMKSIGDFVERWSGAGRFLAVCLTSAVSCSLTSYYLEQSDYAGGTGILCGVVGAACVFSWRHADIIQDDIVILYHVPMIALLLVFEIYASVVNPLLGFIGGFLGGAATSWFLGPNYEVQHRPRRRDGNRRQQYVDKAPVQVFIKAWNRVKMDTTRSSLFAIYLIIIFNGLFFAGQIYTGDEMTLLSWELDIANRGKLTTWGAKVNSKISEGQLWRLATYAFLHYNTTHLLQVCYLMYLIGDFVERLSGVKRFLAICFTSAISCSLTSYFLEQSDYAGGTGILCGVVGAAYVIAWRKRKILIRMMRYKQALLIPLFITPLVGCEGNASAVPVLGFIGGLLGGAAASWFLGPNHVDQPGRRGVQIDKAPLQYLIKAWKKVHSQVVA